MKRINEIEILLGIDLPFSYKKLVDSIDDYSHISFNEFRGEFPNDEGSIWFFWGVDRLFKPTKIIGSINDRLAWQVLSSFFEIQNHNNRSTLNLLTEHQAKNSVTIAEDNGDLLFIDTQNGNSIWRFLHDSGEVKMLAESFSLWIDVAELLE
jgi:hypothetical protein